MTVISRLMAREFQLPPAVTSSVTVQRDLRVPMPDGVHLLADRYTPADVADPPLVLARSPYGRRGVWGMLFGRLLAERGFQAVVQSCRGTAGSGGTLDPFGTERVDGLATVDWLRAQPWYPGGFGTVGPSYLGFTQWAIAAEAGPDHRAIAAQVTISALADMIYAGDSLYLRTMLRWTRDMERQRGRSGAVRRVGAARRTRRAQQALPLRNADRIATGHHTDYFQQWLAHRPGDDYWRDRGFTDSLSSVHTPVNLVGGWYDFMLPWQLRDYAVLRAAGHRPYLTIGAFGHSDPASIRAWLAESLPWLRAHLAGDRTGLREQPVRIFVTGAEQWRELPDWPPPAASRRWHLAAGRRLTQSAPEVAAPDRYAYDPTDPTPALGGPVDLDVDARVDNAALEARPDVLTYTSGPLPAALEVIGVPTVELYVDSDREHFDVFARLCDVDPAGRSLNICDALLRISPDRSAPGPCGTHRVAFDLWPTAHRFAAGHRLRLQVSGGAFPRYARNTGTGEPMATASALLVARQSVHHDPVCPSAVILPVPVGR